MTAPRTTAAGAIAHPAKYSDPILAAFAARIPEFYETLPGWAERDGVDLVLLDSMAGTGKVHQLAEPPYSLPFYTLGYELEPEWQSQHVRTRQGNALALTDIDTGAIAVAFTSPTYGNRMADHHTPSAADTSTRHGYAYYLGRQPSLGSSCNLAWGREYRAFHERWLREQLRVLAPGGLLVINIKNHVRNHKIAHVVEFFLNAAMMLGCSIEAVEAVGVPSLGHGSNREARVGTEKLLWLRTPDDPQPRML